MYSDLGDYKQLKRTPSIKSISKIGDRTLAIIETDSDSSLGSFGSIDSPKTAWRKNQAHPADKNKIKTALDKSIPVNSRIGKQNQDGSLDDDNNSDDSDSNDEDLTDTNSITDSSVASVIEAVNRATDGHHGGSRNNHESDRGEVIEGYFRNPTTASTASAAATAANANGSIYGFTLRRKMAGSQSPAMNTGRPRPSFRQYNATVTSRQSRISVDSLTSPLSSLTLIGNQNKANSGSGNSSSSNNIDSAMTTLSRNRGPRPAYSDANMQHSLGYLP